MRNKVGVLIVTYARGEQAKTLIQKAISSGITEIFVWLDGPATPDIAEIQKNMLASIRELALTNLHVNFHISRAKKNFGAAASVLAGSDYMFSQVEVGVVLEDDLEVEVSFFQDVLLGIELAETDSDIWMTSGTRLLRENTDGCWDVLNYPVGWGWGTTSKKWEVIRDSLSHRQSLREIKGLKARGFWITGYLRAINGVTDAWDTPLAAVMFGERKKCLIPPVNLVTNIGSDEYATHTTEKVWPLGVSRSKLTGIRTISTDGSRINSNNLFYEREVFKIRSFHALTPIYDYFFKSLGITSSKNLLPLFERVRQAAQSSTGSGG
jgi:hypothetical protein